MWTREIVPVALSETCTYVLAKCGHQQSTRDVSIAEQGLSISTTLFGDVSSVAPTLADQLQQPHG